MAIAQLDHEASLNLANQLNAVLSGLDQKDREFAQSICDWCAKKGRISSKQGIWAIKLIRKVFQPISIPTTVVGLLGVYKLFESALASNLKYPKIHFTMDDGSKLVLAIAGEKAAVPGSIRITDGGPYPNNTYYGFINKLGHYVTPKKVQFDIKKITDFLSKLDADPAGMAASHGKEHGKCCFCNKGLTHPKSLKVGFGPQCATKWGLKTEWNHALLNSAKVILEAQPTQLGDDHADSFFSL